MNPRTTGILFLVALALGAFVHFYLIEGEAGRQEAEEQKKRLFSGVEAEAIEWISLTTTDGRPVRAERREQGWEIVEPFAFQGDGFALDGVASALAELASEAVYEDPQPLEVYGLDDESAVVRFGVGGEEHAVRTGDKAPVGGASYAAVLGRESVYTVPTFRVTSLRKSFDDLREKRILRFDADAVERVVASWPDGRVELVSRDGEWRLEEPVEGPADSDTVRDLLSNLSFLRARGFDDEPGSDAETGLANPAFSLEISLAAEGEGEEPRRLAFVVGSEEIGGDRLVRAGRRSLFRIPPERLDDFPRQLVDYRFKRLADFEATEAQSVEIGFSSDAGETLVVTATREEQGWRSTPEAMQPEKISRLVDELSRLEAADILADRVGPEELGGMGLDPARVTLHVYGGPEAGEASRLAELRLGVVRGTGGVVAQTGETPALFELDPGLAEHLPVSLEAFRNRFVAGAEEAAEAPGELEVEGLPPLSPDASP
jgi:hypothetical protein